MIFIKFLGVFEMRKKALFFICIVMVLVLFPLHLVQAKTKSKLSVKSRNIIVGQQYTLKLKNVSKNANIKWKTSKKAVVSIIKKKKNTVVLKGRKKGKATITAKYKGKTYQCKVTVKSKPKTAEKDKSNISQENPVMNASEVSLYYLPDYYKDKITYDTTHLREFRFRVSGTKQEVKKWELVGDDKDFFEITNYGKVTMFWGVGYTDFVKTATVKATLEDGTVVTAIVKTYNEVNLYINTLFEEFKQQYITSDMTELKKAEKVAWYVGAISDYDVGDSEWMHIFIEGKGDCMASRWAVGTLCRYIGIKAWECNTISYHGETLIKADGEFYMFVTGYDEPKPRSYSMWKVPEEQMDKIVEDNGIWMGYFDE